MKNVHIEDAENYLVEGGEKAATACALLAIAEEMRTANMIALLDSAKIRWSTAAKRKVFFDAANRLGLKVESGDVLT